MTFANKRGKLTEDAYKQRIEGYARNFQSVLRTANVFDAQVRSILTGEEVPRGIIPAVPIGDDPKESLVVGKDRTNALLKKVLKRMNHETAIKLQNSEGIFYQLQKWAAV